MAMNRREVAQQLRSVARKIERGQYDARSVTTLSQSREDRLPVHTLRVSFAPKPKK